MSKPVFYEFRVIRIAEDGSLFNDTLTTSAKDKTIWQARSDCLATWNDIVSFDYCTPIFHP